MGSGAKAGRFRNENEREDLRPAINRLKRRLDENRGQKQRTHHPHE